MSALFVPYVAAAVLLVVAGMPKALDPEPTRRVAVAAGLPSGRLLIRLFGAGEVAVGVLALLGGRLPALLVAAAYVGFAVVVTRGLVRGDMESCGCFSGDDSPPSALHVALDLALAAAAAWVALAPAGARSWSTLAEQGVLPALAVAALGATVAGLVYLVLARLPRPVEAGSREVAA